MTTLTDKAFDGPFDKLDNPERRQRLPPEYVLDKISGKVLMDFGCGIGYFSIPAAERFEKVIAIDCSDRMLNELKRRAAGKENIVYVQGTEPEGEADAILIVNVLHEVKNYQSFLPQCLSHAPRVFLIDWQKREMEHGPPQSHRIAKEDVLSLEGLKSKEHPIYDDLYFLEIEKKEA